jgi:DNA polymerase-3 subunit delta'
MIEPSGPLIRIAQIREICHTLGMKPYEARMRAVIIADAHTMNPEAGNALLKVLEEPPDRTMLILTAVQTSDLLPTIVSRCQHIRFHPASQDQLRMLLTGEKPGFSEKPGFRCLSEKEAEIIAMLANGSYSKAISMSRSNWISRRQWLLTELESLFLSKQRGAPHSAARVLAFAEKLSKNKEILPELLEAMNTWVRDLMICKYDAEKLINRDIGDKIQNISRKMTAADLLSKAEAIQSARKKLRANANTRLTMEALALQLAW